MGCELVATADYSRLGDFLPLDDTQDIMPKGLLAAKELELRLGQRGADILKAENESGVIAEIRQWVREFWKEFGNLFNGVCPSIAPNFQWGFLIAFADFSEVKPNCIPTQIVPTAMRMSSFPSGRLLVARHNTAPRSNFVPVDDRALMLASISPASGFALILISIG